MLTAITTIETRPGWQVETSYPKRAWDSYALYKWRGGGAPSAKVDFDNCEVQWILDTGNTVEPFDYRDYQLELDVFPPVYDFTPLLEKIEERISAAEAVQGQFFRIDPELGENIAVVAMGGLLTRFPHPTAVIHPHELRDDLTFVREPYVARVRAIINPTEAMRHHVAEARHQQQVAEV